MTDPRAAPAPTHALRSEPTAPAARRVCRQTAFGCSPSDPLNPARPQRLAPRLDQLEEEQEGAPSGDDYGVGGEPGTQSPLQQQPEREQQPEQEQDPQQQEEPQQAAEAPQPAPQEGLRDGAPPRAAAEPQPRAQQEWPPLPLPPPLSEEIQEQEVDWEASQPRAEDASSGGGELQEQTVEMPAQEGGDAAPPEQQRAPAPPLRAQRSIVRRILKVRAPSCRPFLGSGFAGAAGRSSVQPVAAHIVPRRAARVRP